MVNVAPSPLEALKSLFGYDSFRPLQAEIIDHVLAGQDSLVLMPTGGGKSLCYQLPAMCMPHMTLVVSPLIALMKDQVDALNAHGIAARYINSSLEHSEIDLVQAQAARGGVKILYVAPERLAVPGFRRFLHDVNLSLIAVDEAHCISEWGHEFRPDYRNLRQLRADFPNVPLIALTATATTRVREDIVEQLGLQQGQIFLSSFNRPNLTYSVEAKEGYWGKLFSLLQRHDGESTIIYCLSRRDTEELAEDLNERGFSARPYHAGLGADVRRRTQEDFIRDRVPIIVATVAFGMGIDKPDIRLVVHHALPKSLEGYYQETGRAGRDGLPSDCVLFYAYSDKARQEYFISQIESPQERQNARQKLEQLVEFAEVPLCRRRTLLAYFGESWEPENCGACDVCLGATETFDATEIAQKVLSAVVRTGQRYGPVHVAQVLRGSRDKRILELGHDKLSVYGIAREYSREDLREIITLLQVRGLLVRNEGEFATFSVSAQGRDFLRKEEKLALPLLASAKAEKRQGAGGTRGLREGVNHSDVDGYVPELFEQLRVLRRQLAEGQGVPPYVVFGDVSLRQMATTLPQTLENIATVQGVGQAKLKQYGQQFLDAIKAYAGANNLPDRTLESAGRSPSRAAYASDMDGQPSQSPPGPDLRKNPGPACPGQGRRPGFPGTGAGQKHRYRPNRAHGEPWPRRPRGAPITYPGTPAPNPPGSGHLRQRLPAARQGLPGPRVQL